jgi:hypothetical protein
MVGTANKGETVQEAEAIEGPETDRQTGSVCD